MIPLDHPGLITKRLCLRMPNGLDAPALLALYGDAQVMRHWSHAPWTTLGQAHDAIVQAQVERASGRALHLAIALRQDGALAGSCALFDIERQHRRATLGYLFAPAYWGKGLAREALRALIEVGFSGLGLQRIEAEVEPCNGASRALLERLGFVCEARMRARWRVDGEARDVELWALLRRDWHSPRGGVYTGLTEPRRFFTRFLRRSR